VLIQNWKKAREADKRELTFFYVLHGDHSHYITSYKIYPG